MKQLQDYITAIQPIDVKRRKAVAEHWNAIAKPLHGMGLLETDVERILAILGSTRQLRKCIAVMCADNGVVREGVTQTDSSVTAIVAANMTKGDATVCNMAKVAGADVYIYDVGMNSDVKGTIARKAAYGTCNLYEQDAMTGEQAVQTVLAGIQIAGELKQQGYHLIASGEMGIGNTTTSSAVASVLLQQLPEVVTGYGAGLTHAALLHKTEIIRTAIQRRNPDKDNPMEILAKLGGFDIAAMCGLFLGGAYYQIPIVIDGLISSVAAVLAKRMCPAAADYMLASHLSAEPAAALLMRELQLTPPIQCHMALGEGTGAVAWMPMLDMALQVYYNMPTFAQTNIEEYKPL